MNQSETHTDRPVAAFFDVDGTLVRTNIVHYYIFFRRRSLHVVWRPIWHLCFMIKCLGYLLMDKISRSWLNRVFYTNYRGLAVDPIRAAVEDCFREIIRPKLYRQAAGQVRHHLTAGQRVVLVTGSIDFIVVPLAQHLANGFDQGVTTDCGIQIEAPGLIERNGCFTGELTGPPVGEQEKANRLRRYAEREGIDLADCFGYGDSIADLPMLEVVGHPNVVNPDRALARIARDRDWPVLRWSVEGSG